MKIKRVVGYARVSSREQAEDSHALEQQIARLKAAGATEIFQDIQSGSRDDRPALKQLLDLVHKKAVDEVIITRIDRLARSLPKLRECIHDYHQAQVNLKILDQQIDLNTSQGKLMVNILGSLAEWETDLLSERIQHGKAYRRNKKAASESYPWGYQVVNDKYELDHRLFLCLLSDRPANYLELYHEDDLTKLPGLTIKQIARDCINIFLEKKGVARALKEIFNKYGILKKTAKRNSRSSIFHWTPAGFNRWLNNPVLCGHTAYFQRVSISKGKSKRNKPEDWMIIHDTHPEHRLITDEELVEIKQIINFNSKIGGFSFNQDFDNPICYQPYAYQTGLVFCAECNSRCITKTNNYKGQKYSYFACRYVGMGCSNKKSARKQNIEDALINTLVERSHVLASESDTIPNLNQEKSENLKALESRLEALEQIPGFDPDLEKIKDKTRQQIAEEINPFLYDAIAQKTTEEIIIAGNNLAIWYTLSSDDKVKIYHQIVQRILIRNGEVESVILKI
ncbi:resolvase [Anabaena sp. UHCC 0253]|uniref:fdxN element excision recombinase XisF n=1 Tax=Anabaena sp. UHCC 0253 TaxID=2590019 RepID=UPI001444D58E|nr:fdxN element excision recombinase XisF [Anabaena sp. UHCC 0253]MTJ52651.1 resolvase [Anabaena sp. UHCC 0253]